MNKFEKIIISVICLFVIAFVFLGAIVFRQQKTINSFAGNIIGTHDQSAVQRSLINDNSSSLGEVGKFFTGTISQISKNQLTVDAKLTDFSKPKNPNKLKNMSTSVNLSPDDFEKMDKKIVVNINEKTSFENKKLLDLKVNDEVSIVSDVSPYLRETVTAEKITYIGQ